MAEFEIVLQNQDHLLGYIYKLLFKYEIETKEIKSMIKWMQHFKEVIPVDQWEKIRKKKKTNKKFTKQQSDGKIGSKFSANSR